MIIGVSGKIGTGKSTFAQHLQSLMARNHALGEGVPVLRAFGDPLKQEVAEEFEFPLADCYTTEGKAKVIQTRAGMKTVRELLQYWGTDVRRAQNHDYWVEAFDSYVSQDLRMGNNLIISDARFENEAAWVLDHGGIMLRLDPFEGWQPGPFAGHASETSLDEYPFFTERYRPGHGRLHVTARAVFRRLQELS